MKSDSEKFFQGFTTIYSVLDYAETNFGERSAILVKNGDKKYRSISYTQLKSAVDEIASGLMSLGVEKGDKIALLSENRTEWIYADLATLAIGAVDVPRGSDQSKEDLERIVNHSESKIAFVENEKTISKVLGSDADILIVLDEIYEQNIKSLSGKRIYSLNKIMEEGRNFKKNHRNLQNFEERITQVKKDDLATIIYTSGTTGEPKGVMLSHGNLIHNINCVPEVISLSEEDRFLSVLPPHHILERIVEYICISLGASRTNPSLLDLKKSINSVKPTLILGVPRLWNKLHDTTISGLEKESRMKQAMFNLFYKIGEIYLENSDIINDNVPVFNNSDKLFLKSKKPFARLINKPLKPLYELGDKMAFSKIRDKYGGCVNQFISGASALTPDVETFFRVIGIPVYEGYGATETSPAITFRGPNNNVPETVGHVLSGEKVLILDDNYKPLSKGEIGQIAVSGPNVSKEGYWKNPEKTKSVFTRIDGETYYLTGDSGRFDINDNLQVSGRKASSFKNKSGEWIYPETIENTLQASSLINYVVACGHNQKHVGLLIVPNYELLEDKSEPEIRSMLKTEIEKYRVFTEYKDNIIPDLFKVIPDFQIGVELTHTFKVKRNYVLEKHSSEVKELFND